LVIKSRSAILNIQSKEYSQRIHALYKHLVTSVIEYDYVI